MEVSYGNSGKQRRSSATGDRTLEELDGEKWGEPKFASYVVLTCHALRRKPLHTLSDEELRLAIGQGIGLEWLVPLSLDRLAGDPFRSGDMYEGDLLATISRVPFSYRMEHGTDKTRLATKIIPLAIADYRFAALSREARQTVSNFI